MRKAMPIERFLVGFAVACAAVLPLSVLPASGAECTSSAAETVEARGDIPTGASFTVSARRFWFRASRAVQVHVSPHDDRAAVEVELDRPFRAELGVRHIELTVQLVDATAHVVERIELRFEDGQSRLEFDIDPPSPGAYSLVLEQQDIRLGKARISIRPHGRVEIGFCSGARPLSA